MHKDTKEALARLEKELLEEEKQEKPVQEPEFPDFSEFDLDLFEEAEPTRVIGNEKKPAPSPAAVYNTDDTDEDLESYSREVYESRRRVDPMVRMLSVLAVVLTVCIVAVVAWWVLRYGGGVL